MAQVRNRERASSESSQTRPAGQHIRMRSAADDSPAVVVLKDYIGAQQLDDPFKGQYGGGIGDLAWKNPIQPPYSFYALMKLPKDNSVLGQCIDAMVTNVDGHGHRLEFIGEEGKEDSAEAETEKETLENLLDYPNEDYSMQELRDRLRRDYETIGNAYIEVGRDALGHIVMLSHIPAHTIRMTAKETESVPITVKLPRNGKIESVKRNKRFRRFVQKVGNNSVYFKEFGDPRIIDPATGDATRNKDGDKIRLEDSATEIIHLCTYNPDSPYGMPRWFNQISTILGMRQAELVNLDFFRDNAIPAMMLMVSGGAVTQSSLDAISDHFNAVRGRSSMNRILVVEASGDSSAADEEGRIPPPKLEAKPLSGDRQNDGTFQEYDKNGRDKVRSAFRLPPIFLGSAQDYTYATARTSYDVAEGQVFAPERQRFDDMINLKILSTYDPKFWSYRSNPPRLSDKNELIEAIGAFDAAGGLTPNVIIGLANELFDLEIEQVTDDWGNFPYDMVTTAIGMQRLEPKGLFNKEAPAPVLPGMPGDPNAPGGKAPAGKKPADKKKPGNDNPKDKKPVAENKVASADTASVVTRSMLELSEQLSKLRDGE